MNTLEKRIKAKAKPLRKIIDQAREARVISSGEDRSSYFSQFDDRDPDPPFSQFNNPSPPWGKA